MDGGATARACSGRPASLLAARSERYAEIRTLRDSDVLRPTMFAGVTVAVADILPQT